MTPGNVFDTRRRLKPVCTYTIGSERDYVFQNQNSRWVRLYESRRVNGGSSRVTAGRQFVVVIFASSPHYPACLYMYTDGSQLILFSLRDASIAVPAIVENCTCFPNPNSVKLINVFNTGRLWWFSAFDAGHAR